LRLQGIILQIYPKHYTLYQQVFNGSAHSQPASKDTSTAARLKDSILDWKPRY